MLRKKNIYYVSQRYFTSYTSSLNLPKTTFDVNSKIKDREENLIELCCDNIYKWQNINDNNKIFILHDGPPFANGSLHMGHALNKILKDMIIRYKILCGFKVEFVPGWDCHGLPIELKALKQYEYTTNDNNLNDNNEEIINHKALVIREKARKFALKALKAQREDMRRWGVVGDWNNYYYTMDPIYEATQLRVFSELVSKGQITRGFKPVYWSPSSKTALAEAELEYLSDHISDSIYLAFKMCEISSSLNEILIMNQIENNNNINVLIWTTTPWTIPANKAIAFKREIEYALCKINNELYIIAKSLKNLVEKEIQQNIKILCTFMGDKLENCITQHPLINDQLSPLLHGDHVDLSGGTGLVHTAPGHGIDDWKLCMEHQIEAFCPVDDSGCFTIDIYDKDLIGLNVLEDGQKKVLEKLQTTNKLLSQKKYKHRYPYDWRTKKPIIFRATAQWFMSIDNIKNMANNIINNVNFIPSSGKSTLTKMLSIRNEWCISRQRSWGVPIPVFYEKDSNNILMTSESIEHICKLVSNHPKGTDCWWQLSTKELLPPSHQHLAHKYIRGYDTLDVWFDSGTSWRSSLHKRQHQIPLSDIIIEGTDQYRGWFQSSLITSIACQNMAPYRQIITHGFVVDENSKKMSKSIGNVIEPNDIINGKLFDNISNLSKSERRRLKSHGVELIRLWISSVDYTHDVPLSITTLRKVSQVLQKWRNTWRYMLGGLFDFNIKQHNVSYDKLWIIDQYILCELHDLCKNIKDAYELSNFVRVYNLMVKFHTDLSSIYFEICKDRLYAENIDSHSRRCAQTVFSQILNTVVRLAAPILPFSCEEIYQHSNEQLYNDNNNMNINEKHTIFELGWPNLKKISNNNNNILQYGKDLILLRETINKCVEVLRQDKIVKNVLSVEISIFVDNVDEFSKLYNNNIEELRDVLTVSNIIINTSNNKDIISTSNVILSNNVEVKLNLHHNYGEKCERCWNYRELNENLLCKRCNNIMSSL